MSFRRSHGHRREVMTRVSSDGMRISAGGSAFMTARPWPPDFRLLHTGVQIEQLGYCDRTVVERKRHETCPSCRWNSPSTRMIPKCCWNWRSCTRGGERAQRARGSIGCYRSVPRPIWIAARTDITGRSRRSKAISGKPWRLLLRQELVSARRLFRLLASRGHVSTGAYPAARDPGRIVSKATNGFQFPCRIAREYPRAAGTTRFG